MQKIHLVSHTHWDREWYLTFQQFRLKLVRLIDGLIDIFDQDPQFEHFMLDGQTIVLDDYLQMRPEMEEVLRRHIRAGRILVGPWHILPDMYLVSPEAHIRNLLAGDRVARRFGRKMMIGYMPDSFGHIGQMPQILQGFGIDNACLWRGLDDQPVELWWQSPDGTRVLLLYLRDSYSNGAALDANDQQQFAERIEQAADSLAPHSVANDLLVMYGTDHMQPPRATSKAIKAANKQLKGYRIVHSTLPAYLDAIRSSIERRRPAIPVVVGELRSSKRSHLLPGVLSTRMWIKQRNHACENLLERWAEPFSTFATLASDDRPSARLRRPSSIVRQAWMLLLQNHPHDSICGCSIDQVHDEMRSRFDQVEQIGEEITRQSLEALAGAVDTRGQMPVAGDQSAIVVFNPLSAARTDVVSADVSLPPGMAGFEIVDETGGVVPHQSASGKTAELINVRVPREELGGLLAMIHEGRAGNLAVQDLRFERDGAILRVEAVFAENASPRLAVWNEGVKTLEAFIDDTTIETFHIRARLPESASVTFCATDVPGLGWRTFFVRGKESVPAEIKVTPLMKLLAPLARLPLAQKLLARSGPSKARPPYVVENDLLAVELDADDCTLSVTDKATGQIYRGLNRFVDSGDCGDEYNFSPPPNDSQQNRPKLRAVRIQRGAVQHTMTVELSLRVPAQLSADRTSRSKESVEIPIETRITLTNRVPRVDVHTRVDNRARDHRLRVHFPAPFATDSADYDGHLEIVTRPIGIPPFDDSWVEEPRPETHQRAFTAVSDGSSTLAIANRGLPEVEVLRSAGTLCSEIALTLLRCVGWLSRDDLTTRKGHAGPALETPKAQMIGAWEFDYSIIVARDRLSCYQQAWNFDSPLRAQGTASHPGTLPASGTFVGVDNPLFFVSAVKEADRGRGWIVRGVNMGDEEISVALVPWRRFGRAQRVNLAEETIGRLEVGRDGEVTLCVRGHEVVTVLLDK